MHEVAGVQVPTPTSAGWAEDSCKEQCARGDGGAGRGQLQMPHELDVYTRLGQRVGTRGSARIIGDEIKVHFGVESTNAV
mmetsp:Transcript_45389/g.86793  ORF Transcript_45389/g.86793 Transcript_45389/m.86793 type:complete len:80 (-) Transcript_45389:247-486(-)